MIDKIPKVAEQVAEKPAAVAETTVPDAITATTAHEASEAIMPPG